MKYKRIHFAHYIDDIDPVKNFYKGDFDRDFLSTYNLTF